MKDFRNKVAVVTGAASGIGRALATRFANEGMKVVLSDVEEQALARAARELADKGATTLAVRADVSKTADVEALAEQTVRAFGGAHVLCNNAGVVAAGLLWELTPTDWEWVVGVNLWGVIHGTRVFVPIMLGQDTPCHIVNTASMAGLVSGPYNSVYTVTKHAVVALSESLHHDLRIAGSSIGVSVLCPGWVNTRIMEAERNRPAGLASGRPERAPTEQQQTMEQVVRQLLASGLSPDHVAERVFDAIRTDRFYVLTHPEWKGMIKNRMEDILEERMPSLTSFV